MRRPRHGTGRGQGARGSGGGSDQSESFKATLKLYGRALRLEKLRRSADVCMRMRRTLPVVRARGRARRVRRSLVR